MTARRLISVLTVALSAGAGVSASVDAQPAPQPTTQPAKKKAARPTKGRAGKTPPLAPAKGTGSGAGSGAGSGSAAGASAGSAVQMAEDPPPSDITGTAENPDAPHSMVDGDAPPAVEAVAAPVRPAGYPIEEALRPITPPPNLSEVSLLPHAQVSPYAATTALRV